nr:pectinesterase inhibitor-like [Ipomoea batatas]GMD76506.1 pectinesterase inhibitor-like [Ipomoea batatas]GME08469.1 pectinesterase inhibitor-like [Ipomoea batatas]
MEALKSDRRSKTASLEGLAFIAIDAADKYAKTVRGLVQSLLKSAKTAQLKSRYSSCLENYEDSIDSLDRCTEFLKAKDYGSLDSYASAALDFPGTCDDDFADPPAEPGQLKAASAKLQDFCDVVLLVSSKLSGRKVQASKTRYSFCKLPNSELDWCRLVVNDENFLQLWKEFARVLNMIRMSNVLSNTFTALESRFKHMSEALVKVLYAYIFTPATNKNTGSISMTLEQSYLNIFKYIDKSRHDELRAVMK